MWVDLALEVVYDGINPPRKGNLMATKKSTAANADLIGSALRTASQALRDAQAALTRAKELMATGENDPELHQISIQNFQGALQLVAGAVNLEAAAWSGYAQARQADNR